MTSISIGMTDVDVQPSVDVQTLGKGTGDLAGRRFISLRLGEDVTLIPAGFDASQVAYARALAAALTAAADELEQPALVVAQE